MEKMFICPVCQQEKPYFCKDLCRSCYYKMYKQKPDVRTKILAHNKDYYKRPEVRIRQNEWKRIYRKNPEVKKQRREYKHRPEVIERTKELYNTPEHRQKRREYLQRPEVKARKRELYNQPEMKEKARERGRRYHQNHRDEILIKQKIYHEKNRERLLAKSREFMQSEEGKKWRKEYQSRPEIRKRINEYANLRRFKPNESMKWIVRAKTRYAIKVGKLIPTPCQKCGNPHVEAHHKEYTLEKILDVVWLCIRCHDDLHFRFGGDLEKFLAWQPTPNSTQPT